MSDDDKPTVVDEFFEVTGLSGNSFLTRGTAQQPRAPRAAHSPEHPAEQQAEHPAEQQAARIMAQASRFHDTGRIGVGGMGEVHKVYDQVLQRQVAMKNLLAQLAGSTMTTRRFLQEVLITAQLDHPNIVPVHDVGFHDDGSAFFVMKLVRGENLAAQIRSHHGQPLTSRQLERYLRIFLKVCEAVSFAHSRGVIHRDLKPSNIMVGPHGEVFVMDWGIALVRNDDSTAQSPERVRTAQVHVADDPDVIIGTGAYMAPEQARAETHDIDARTDIFALGGILYHILTSQPPYPGPELAVQIALAGHADVPHPARVVKDRRLPPRLCHITMKALARRREDRYQSVTALAEDVEAFLRGGGWFDTVHFAPGTVIVNEGDEPDAAYIIEKGRCEVIKIRNGRRHMLRMLGPGDVFGETSIFTGMPRTATVVAIDEVRAASITREALDLELAEKGWLAAFVKGLAERFNDYDESSIELRMKTES